VEADSSPLFSARVKVHPKAVRGSFRRAKWLALAALLAIYYLAPWIRWERGPNAAAQAILIDFPGRRFYFFFIEIWPQEIYYLTGLLVLAALGLFFVTSLFGRIWCGFTCPQTVWTDLFIKIEQWVEGDRNARLRLDQAPWTGGKIARKVLKHLLWIVIGVLTGGAWIFYFADAPTLAGQLLSLEAPAVAWTTIAFFTMATYVMAGVFREQVCTYMCPYARFQSAMFDQDTLIIGYDTDRGEPRGKHKSGQSWEGRGHCIDCSLCVQVCPTGIDIRDGLQLPCIACGLCVDACNSVMDKLGLPPGLIRYDTNRNQKLRRLAAQMGQKFTESLRLIRPRTLYYGVILTVVGGLIVYGQLTRSLLELHVLHERSPLFVMLSNGHVRNNYTIKISNKAHNDREYHLEVKGLNGAELEVVGADKMDAAHLPVFANSVGAYRAMVIQSPDALPSKRQNIQFVITDNSTQDQVSHDSIFISAIE
jgi:cytochrome c oxidase accessory protein FixG